MGELERCSQTGKVCFATKGEALFVLKTPHKRPNVNGSKKGRLRKKREKRAYLCEHCDTWHLTSQEYFKNDSPKRPSKRN